MRSYMRLDPRMAEKKLAAGYTLAQIGAYAMLLTQAEQQPQRGRFKTMALLKAAMDCMAEEHGPRARASQYLPFLLDQSDVVKVDAGGYYVPGWDEWQEGDHTPKDRMELVRGRRDRPGRPGDPESPGARRQRRYRARQASPEGETSPDAVPSQGADHSDVTKDDASDASHGEIDCDERHVARDLDVSTSGKPKAVSTSGGDASPSGDGDTTGGAVRGPKKPAGPPLSPEAVVLIQGYQELGYAQPSATDQIRAEEYVVELVYLTAAEMVERMRGLLEWCQREGKPRPASLAGFWKTLRAENDFRRDNGAKAPEAVGRPMGEGLTAFGDIAASVLGGAAQRPVRLWTPEAEGGAT